jgi:hypothetical protein
MTRKQNQASLNVEDLESRELAATSLGLSATAYSWTTLQTRTIAPTTIQVSYGSAYTGAYGTSLDGISGIRINHNETVVRARKTRRKKGN